MKTNIGDRVTTPMANGLLWPAIVISAETAEQVTVTNRNTGAPVDIIVTRADCISLRETREGVEYLAVTTEVIQYGYRAVAMPRFSSVVGLDADKDGAVLTLQELLDAHGKSYSEFVLGQYEARQATSAADL